MEQIEYLAPNGMKYKEWEDAVRYGNDGKKEGIKKITKSVDVSVVDASDMPVYVDPTIVQPEVSEAPKVKKGPFGRPVKVKEPETEQSGEVNN